MKTLNRILSTALAVAGLLGTALPAHAKLTADEAARLGADAALPSPKALYVFAAPAQCTYP